MAHSRSKKDPFKELTWRDLEDWAGSTIVSRGKSYQRGKQVKELSQTKTGGIVAWVAGTQQYATQVTFEAGELVSNCTCPYGATCKHAVAVVLEYLDRLKNNSTVPTAATQDRRLELLASGAEYDSQDEDDEEDADRFGPMTQEISVSRNSSSFLKKQTNEQLMALIEDLAGRHPAVRKDLHDRQNLSEGNIKKLVRSIQKEIRELSSEPGWTNHWKNEGYIPDYSQVKDRLKALLVRGYADEVIELGRELLKQGTQQIEMSNDEGETAGEIASCVDIIFQALPQSSLPTVEKMLWAVETGLNDQYELCSGAEFFWKQKHSAADWNALAEKLTGRLNQFAPAREKDTFLRHYARDRLSDWVIHAMEKAGRHKEIIPLCEQEAEKTGNYRRLVDYLIKARRIKEAEQWIYKGIKATLKQAPGIASGLRNTLRELREKEGDWLFVASFWAEDFFQHPSCETFQKLQKAAQKAKVLPEVRAAALQYLETGKLPLKAPSWPLPETGTTERIDRGNLKFPMTEPLIDIAIAEKRTDDVIRWYDLKSTSKETGWWGNDSQDDRIADAIADSYPDRAAAIWKKLAEGQIAVTQPKAYEVAAGYLRKVNRLLVKLGREKDWQSYAAELRIVNAKKKRFIQTLDSLTGRPIVNG